MKKRLVTQADDHVVKSITDMAEAESRTVSAMTLILLKEALIARLVAKKEHA